jgi:hypothetical protein
MLQRPDLLAFSAHALLILERLREQEAGEIAPEMDPTDFALRLLVTAEVVGRDRGFPFPRSWPLIGDYREP